MAPNVFSVPVFLVVFRETLETAIIVSVLLAFLKKTLGVPGADVATYKSLRKQVWLGVAIGFFICLVVAGAMIGVFYRLQNAAWEKNELYYEGAFSLFAAIVITIMGAALLRIGKMQAKWRVKLAAALEAPVRIRGKGFVRKFFEKYAMFVLPFITVLREGIEAIVFIGGVSFATPAKSVPLAVVVGLVVGILAGYILYKGGITSKFRIFLVLSSCLLYLVAAGLFTRAVWSFEAQKWNEAIGGEAQELGSGPGSYDIDKSVWHINCCSPHVEGGKGWGILNALLGWENSATYGSVISYNLYWIFVICMFLVMRFREVKGHWPFMKPKASTEHPEPASNGSEDNGVLESKAVVTTTENTT